jgi:site-specific recombinase XerD
MLNRTTVLHGKGGSRVVDLRDAVSYHQLVLASEGRSVKTQRQYLIFERVFLHYLEARRIAPELDALNVTNVREALAWYRAQDVSQRTRNGEVAAQAFIDIMHLLARFLEREGILEDDPLRGLRRVKVAKRLRQPYSQAEVIALWGACRQSQQPTRDEALLLLLLDTGMRIGEACALTLDKLKLDQRMVLVGEHGKGRRERVVPIGQSDKRDGGRTLRSLRRYLAERHDGPRAAGRLFLGRDGYPLEAGGGSDIVERLGKTAHVADPGPHRLRHTYATWYLVTYPGDEIGLRRIIGHVSREVLSDYVHFAESIIAERAGNASLAERWLNPHSEPAKVPYQGGDLSNVRSFHCRDCQQHAMRHTH